MALGLAELGEKSRIPGARSQDDACRPAIASAAAFLRGERAMDASSLLGMLVLAAPLFLAAWVLDKTLPWLDRKLEGRKIKLGPWKIYKESPFLGGNWILSTRTHGYRLKNVAGNIWVIFCFAAVGLFLAYGFLLAR